jgi:hypothetical protein
MKRVLVVVSGLGFLCASAQGNQPDKGTSRLASYNSFLGSWAFELPDGAPAWFQLREVGNRIEGNLLWSVGSPRPVERLTFRDGSCSFLRKIRWKPNGVDEELRAIDDPMIARITDRRLELKVVQFVAKTGKEETLELIGNRMPPLPERPDLKRVRFGQPLVMFNGRDLSGWRLSNPNKKNGWRVEDGVLVNDTPKKDFSGYGEYGNLRTDREFEDFRLTIEYNVPPGGNSGVFLRGMYEAQVLDPDTGIGGTHGPGSIYGRIAPTANVAEPGGEWNRYELTLVDRHISVVLNGQKVIDNQPVEGCTGGGLSADDTRPGPILLQGDHTSVRFRNIVLRPVIRFPHY